MMEGILRYGVEIMDKMFSEYEKDPERVKETIKTCVSIYDTAILGGIGNTMYKGYEILGKISEKNEKDDIDYKIIEIIYEGNKLLQEIERRNREITKEIFSILERKENEIDSFGGIGDSEKTTKRENEVETSFERTSTIEKRDITENEIKEYFKQASNYESNIENLVKNVYVYLKSINLSKKSGEDYELEYELLGENIKKINKYLKEWNEYYSELKNIFQEKEKAKEYTEIVKESVDVKKLKRIKGIIEKIEKIVKEIEEEIPEELRKGLNIYTEINNFLQQYDTLFNLGIYNTPKIRGRRASKKRRKKKK